MRFDFDREELDERQKKLYHTSLFLGKLLVAGIFFQLILWVYPDTGLLQSGLAKIVSVLLQLSGLENTAWGIKIFTKDAVYLISQDCLGWKSIAAFTGLIFASDHRLGEHAEFIGLGATAIASANILRVVTTIHLSDLGIVSFDIIHGFLWKWSLTLFVLILWGLWFRQRALDK